TWGHGDISTPCSEMTQENQTIYGTWATTGHPHSRHTYDLLVVAQNTGELILLRQSGLGGGCSPGDYNTWRNAGTIHHYNPEGKTWTPAVGTTAFSVEAAEYDPISGKIVIVGANGLWTYDPVQKILTKQVSYVNDAMGYANNLIYYPP